MKTKIKLLAAAMLVLVAALALGLEVVVSADTASTVAAKDALSKDGLGGDAF